MSFKRALGTIVLASTVGLIGCNLGKVQVLETEYIGKSNGYIVSIVEYKQSNNHGRTIYLDAVDEKTVPYAVTGRDDDSNGTWESIRIRKNETNGYNELLFGDRGEYVWNPCPEDKEKVEMPTPFEVVETIALIDRALLDVHRYANIVKR